MSFTKKKSKLEMAMANLTFERDCRETARVSRLTPRSASQPISVEMLHVGNQKINSA